MDKIAATKRVQTRCPIPLAAILITNKLTFDPPTRLPEMTHNVIRSSHGHSTPSLKISCKSVQPFSRNLADKERKKERKKQTNRAICPTGGRVNNITIYLQVSNVVQICTELFGQVGALPQGLPRSYFVNAALIYQTYVSNCHIHNSRSYSI